MGEKKEEKDEEGMLVGLVDVLKKLAAAAAPGA
jgi:hypothetical protein